MFRRASLNLFHLASSPYSSFQTLSLSSYNSLSLSLAVLTLSLLDIRTSHEQALWPFKRSMHRWRLLRGCRLGWWWLHTTCGAGFGHGGRPWTSHGKAALIRRLRPPSLPFQGSNQLLSTSSLYWYPPFGTKVLRSAAHFYVQIDETLTVDPNQMEPYF